MSKADNMLAILWILRSGKRVTAQQLADKLEVHIRTVYRCIDSLCMSGVPIIADSGTNGGYQILGAFADSPLLFDLEEQKALVHASVFATSAGYPFTDALERAIDKLKHYTNEKQLDQIERHSHGISVIYPPNDRKLKPFLRLLEDATAHCYSLHMDYVNGKEGITVARIFDPYGIVHWKGVWYTVGHCRLRQDIRSFRVDRIAGLLPSELQFERPDDFSAQTYLLSRLLPDLTNEETLVTVIIEGHEHALNELSQHWMFGHALIERKEGTSIFKLSSDFLVSFVPYYLLPYGKALTIQEPAILIQRMAEVSEGMAQHYRTMLKKKGDSN